MDKTRLEDPYSHIPMSALACDHRKAFDQYVCWCKYPQSLYPNWTERQQKKSALLKVIDNRTHSCAIHYLDVKKDGIFVNGGVRDVNRVTQDTHWQGIRNEVSHFTSRFSVPNFLSFPVEIEGYTTSYALCGRLLRPRSTNDWFPLQRRTLLFFVDNWLDSLSFPV